MEYKPLEGIRVLEIAAYISGPYAGSLLSALGAEVVKVEPPEGDAFRRGEGNRNAYFVQYNTGKKSIAVNLKSADGTDLVRSLLPRFDVLIQNMRPGKLAELGLGERLCREINPRLIYLSVSGYGNGGPLIDRPAYDSMGQALGGFYTVMNDSGDVRLTGTCLADLITGINVAMGVLAALVGRGRTPEGTGVQIDTSVFEAVSTLTIDAMTQAIDIDQDPVRVTRHPQAQNFCLKTASGGFIVLHLSSSEKFWQSLMRAIGRADLIDEPRFRRFADRMEPECFAEIGQILEHAFAQKPQDAWERILTEADVPHAPTLTMREIARHQQTQWLELLDRPSERQVLVQPPWRFNAKRPNRSRSVPHVGEHTREILSELKSAEELDLLVEKGTIFEANVAAR